MYVVIVISIILQLTAAVLALRLVRITGMRLGWVSIAIGLSLMAWRRLVVFQDLYQGNVEPSQIMFPEAVAVVLSAFLCLGVATIGPYFRSVEENYKLRQESERKYKAVADLTYDWEYWLDEDLSFIYVSPSCYRICGHACTAIMQNPGLLEKVLEPKDYAVYSSSIHRIISEKESVNDILNVRHVDGNEYIVRHIAVPAYVDGNFCGVRGSFCNITEAHRDKLEVIRLNQELENRVQIRTNQLEAANRELEAFVYSVSHDLKAPLRHLDGYAKVICEDYSDKLDEQGRAMLSRISNAATEMNMLMDGLLRLSRVARKDLILEDVNLSAIAEVALADYKQNSPDTRTDLSVQQDIKVYADKALLQDVLINLIDNSWKFSAKKPETRISINRCAEPGYEGFTIEDNGVGFRKEDEDKLFKVFSRLHSDSDYKGTGVGLATILRIIQRHQGMIRADSEEGSSTKFTVLLPTRASLAD